VCVCICTGLKDELGFDGSLEEFGRRLASIAVNLGDTHYRALAGEERRMGLLQLVCKQAGCCV
jgi:hypothetical protein